MIESYKDGSVLQNIESGSLICYYSDMEIKLSEWKLYADRPHDHDNGKYSYMCRAVYCRCQS